MIAQRLSVSARWLLPAILLLAVACGPSGSPPPAPASAPAGSSPAAAPASASSPTPAIPAAASPPASAPAGSPAAASPAAQGSPATQAGAAPTPSPAASASPSARASPAAQASPEPGRPFGARLPATLVLDWFPNTNHAGIYLARARGWYSSEGLDLKIETPSDVSAAMKLVGAGNAELGISYQPAVTIARAQDVPVVSVAALVQHNLGAFAAKKSSGITRPKEFEGKRYGSSGIPQAQLQMQTVVRCDGGDPGQVEEVTVGQGISQALLADRVDFMALLPTWEGIELEQKGAELTYIPYQSYCLPDTYNLVFISSENTIKEKAEVIRRFMRATQRGYEAAAQYPEEAESALLQAAPDLNREVVQASMQRLSPFFLDASGRWGSQEAARWRDYAAWMADNKLIPKPIDADRAFTSEFVLR